MNYLAIDASTEACSVALVTNTSTFKQFDLCPQSHSVAILPMVDNVLSQANLKLSELDGLVFGRGPGSFTGVRIGIGVAQGLGFAANLPMVGVSTLQAMAQQAFEKTGAVNCIAAIDARMGEVYIGQYQLNDKNIMTALNGEQVLPPDNVADFITEIPNTVAVGTGWQTYKPQLNFDWLTIDDDLLYPHAIDMITLSLEDFNSGNTVDAERAQPVYVRDTVSWKKLPGRE